MTEDRAELDRVCKEVDTTLEEVEHCDDPDVNAPHLAVRVTVEWLKDERDFLQEKLLASEAEVEGLKQQVDARRYRARDAIGLLRDTSTLRADCGMVDDAAADACAEMKEAREQARELEERYNAALCQVKAHERTMERTQKVQTQPLLDTCKDLRAQLEGDHAPRAIERGHTEDDEQSSNMRCSESGYQRVCLPDGRRGLWLRDSHHSVELCGGRDGDDSYVKLSLGEPFTVEQSTALLGVIWSVDWAFEVAMEDSGYFSFLRRVAHLRDDVAPTPEVDLATIYRAFDKLPDALKAHVR